MRHHLIRRQTRRRRCCVGQGRCPDRGSVCQPELRKGQGPQ
jgi:hypothetical protein